MFEPKIKKFNNFLNFICTKKTIGITLCPFGIYIKDYNFTSNYISKRITINHEKIHWQQQLEMLIIPFYICYFLEWLIKTIIYRKNAYRYISFEKEAFNYAYDIKYLKARKHFTWIKFLKD